MNSSNLVEHIYCDVRTSLLRDIHIARINCWGGTNDRKANATNRDQISTVLCWGVFYNSMQEVYNTSTDSHTKAS